MLILQFLYINAHFTLNLLAALVCFAVTWLYFDAWLGRRDGRESTKSLGFLLLSLSFVVHSTTIDQSVLQTPFIDHDIAQLLTAFFRTGGYIILIIGQIIDPLQPLPSYRKKKKARAILILGLPIVNYIPFLFPIFGIITAFLYIRRATVGLEHHLKPIGYSFFLLAISETISLAALFRGSDNVSLENFVGSFGPLWMLEHFFLALSMFILGRWVWSYLIKRLETQLFMIFTSTTLAVFLMTAIFFTSVSLANLRQDVLTSLKANAGVLQYTLDSKKAETLSDAQVIAQNPDIVAATEDENREELLTLTTDILLAKKQAFLVVVNSEGRIIMRADDPDKAGGSLSDDTIVSRALNGEEAVGVVTRDGVLAPIVSVRSAVPIRSGNDIVGVVLVGSQIDNAFVDGIKDATGLDASIYADNIRSATTFVSADGKSRWIGIKEENQNVKNTTLVDSEVYSGSVSVLNTSYLSAFSPLVDINNKPIGMIFVGRAEVSILQAGGKLIEQTFLVTAVLLIISIIPAFFISRYIIDQIKS